MIFISLLILIVVIALFSKKNKTNMPLYNRISAIILFYAGVLSFNALYIQSIGSGIGIYSGLFQVTLITQFMDTFLLIIGSLILVAWPIIYSRNVLDNKTSTFYATEYSLIVLFTTLGASLLISSSDLISMYLSIELQSFGVYILASLYRDSDSATAAGLKYFLLGGLSSCLILLGGGLLYTFTGLTNFESIYTLISVSYTNNIIQGITLGLLLMIIGFLFKIAAAPLHNWAPDVYDDSPTIVTIWLTIMPKISILILLLELNTQIGIVNSDIISPIYNYNLLDSITSLNLNNLDNGLGTSSSLSQYLKEFEIGLGNNTINLIKILLLISSLLSLIIGTIVGLAQIRIKRLLAYSTISHIGFILLALSISTEQSIESLIFYIIQYSITNLNSFLIIIALSYIFYNSVLQNILLKLNSQNNNINSKNFKNVIENTDINFISEFKGQFFANPLLSLSLSISLFSMAGIPPLIGFFSKQFVLYSAIQSGYYFMAIVAILVSVISASYYLKIIRVLHTEVTEELEKETITLDENRSVNNNIFNSKYLGSILAFNSESSLTNFHSFLISSLTLSILLFVLKPSIILSSMRILSISIFYF
jgi:NADH-ubiquinone oxidoreductase chain 2